MISPQTCLGRTLVVLLLLGLSRIPCLVGRQNDNENVVNIVFIYSIVPSYCKYGMPTYILQVLNHTVTYQQHARVWLGTNLADCEVVRTEMQRRHKDIELIDIGVVQSERTRWFANQSALILQSDQGNELWRTSALRFFNLEDIMRKHGFSEVFHVEADNALYTQIHRLVPLLKAHYPLAAVPQRPNRSVVTASVLWAGSVEALSAFTNYMLTLVRDQVAYTAALAAAPGQVMENVTLTESENSWLHYTNWLRKYERAKRGRPALMVNSLGIGIKPFAVNEMSMLAHYQHLHPEFLLNLPVVPPHPDLPQRRPFSDVRHFAPGGSLIGPWSVAEATTVTTPTTASASGVSNQLNVPSSNAVTPTRPPHSHSIPGIWDAGSWGQYLGGTSVKRGLDRRFIDTGHISGQAIIMAGCNPVMLCDRRAFLRHHNVRCPQNATTSTNLGQSISTSNHAILEDTGFSSATTCLVSPFVQCTHVQRSTLRTPLYNLHIHSKNVTEFLSVPCDCGDVPSVAEAVASGELSCE